MVAPVEPTERGAPVRDVSPAILNVALGAWLFISAFAWRHSQAQMTNTWILGILCAAFAIVSMAVPRVRHLNSLLAIWLFISAWALPTVKMATVWNNSLVAIAVFVLSLVPATTARAPFIDARRQHPAGGTP